jgi:hypothetical protein
MTRKALRTSTAVTASLLLAAGVGISTTSPASAGAHRAPDWEVVARHLNNPRQLTFTRDGTLYVAESGRGGSGPCMTGPEGAPVCFGKTGSVTQIRHQRQRRVLTGLPSLANQGSGSQAIGPSDLVVRQQRRFVISVGLGAKPSVRKQLPARGRAMGWLLKGTLRNNHIGWHRFANIAGFEARVNPVNNRDSNPVGLVRRPGGGFVVSDAGGNTLVRARPSGRVGLIATFPDRMVDAPPMLGLPEDTQIPMQAVPTSVAIGPDKAYYVSQLTGFPFPPGAANIYRVVPGQAPTVYASDLTNVTDLAFGPDGVLYVVELASDGLLSTPEGRLPQGSLMRIPAGGGDPDEVVDDLPAPYGVALRGGWAYLTTSSTAARTGKVVRVRLP